MNFKSWLLISEMSIISIESLKTKSLQAVSKTEPSPKLRARYKFLISEWDTDNTLTPSDVRPGSAKIINWKCLEKEHKWSAPLFSRTKGGNNCSCCSNQKVCDDNNLQFLSENELNPKLRARYKFLISEWDTDNTLTPSDITPGSAKIINWKCLEKGHKWPAPLRRRVQEETDCTFCANRQISKDNNLQYLSQNETNPNLIARYQRLVSEWDGPKNKKEFNLTASDITPGSNKSINWKCLEKGHKWSAPLSNRLSGRNCPCCANQKVCKDNNLKFLSQNEPNPKLRARYQRLVSEWDKNNILTPKDVTLGSGEFITWKCLEKEHTWSSSLDSRTKGTNCPCCANQKVCKDNNLKFLSQNEPNLKLRARYQRLVSEWDKNNILDPKDVLPQSNKMINWKCKKEHIWPAMLNNRTLGRNCPICNESKGEEEIFKILQKYISPKQITRQYNDIDCRGDCLPLPFDFIVEINGKKYFIEYNGEPHYRPIFGSTPEERKSIFEKRQRYDKVKLDYCRSKNIPFLVIPYTQYKNIDTIISSFLKTKTFDSKFAELGL